MWTYLHNSDAASPDLLAASEGLAVLLPDSPLHRRVAVHYLYLPGHDAPTIYGHVTLALEQALAYGYDRLCLIHEHRSKGLRYYLVQPHLTEARNPNG